MTDKTKKAAKKLSLKKETLRRLQLTDAQLGAVAGGATHQTHTTSPNDEC